MSRFSLKCPACRKKWAWDPAEGFPEYCKNPQCETRIAHDRDDDDIVVPFISTSGKTKATDQVYRDMERGSELRAQAAAEMTGATAAEVSGIKITDLKPTTRHGDIAAPPVDPQVYARLGKSADQMFGGSNGSEYSGAVQNGPYPNSGAHTRTALQNMHSDMVARHCVGKSETGAPVIPSTAVTSDRPANEVLQPGYRIRG